MYRRIEDNDTVACINLMMKSFDHNEGYGVGYENKNEGSWIAHLGKHIYEAQSNPHFFTQAAVTDDGKVKGFFLASTFRNYYTDEWTMDVKDCIVDHEYNTAFMVVRFFDHMMWHMKEHGYSYWRADSVRGFDDSLAYAKLLHRRYNATVAHSMRGKIGE